jgi:hemerythrin
VALHWSSTLAFGIPELDNQHRELFSRVDRLLDSMLHGDRREASQLAGFLRDHVTLHFAEEERLMRDLKYPETDDHAAEHATFAASILELDSGFRENGPTADLVLRLEREAVAWLRDHVYVTDVKLGRFISTTTGADTSWA